MHCTSELLEKVPIQTWKALNHTDLKSDVALKSTWGSWTNNVWMKTVKAHARSKSSTEVHTSKSESLHLSHIVSHFHKLHEFENDNLLNPDPDEAA